MRGGRGIIIEYVVRDGLDLLDSIKDVYVQDVNSNDIVTKISIFRDAGF